MGNKADVAHERALRQCLKNETLKIAATFIAPNELKNFNTALEQTETAAFTLYKTLIFCQTKQDSSWCTQTYQEDTSLGKLLLEKQLTAQTMQTLINTLNAKQGSLIF
ncbi:MAG: hypothetical protein J6J35_00310 [Alphaproteobacteria bacterium]|nr:hypothetical protein [Alphaproteobacteria bacterium]